MNDRWLDALKARVEVRDDGCWEWTGQRAERYGRFYAGDTRERWAHRISYKLHVGPIPDHLEIDHLCRFTFCVNPEHMELVTPEENKRRAREAFTPKPHGTIQRARVCSCDTCRPVAQAYRAEYMQRRRDEFARGLLDAEHGTAYTYGNLGCRCDECRAAQREVRRRQRRARGVKPQRQAQHGTTSMYTAHKCRCDECRQAWADYWKAYRARKRQEAA